MGTHGQSDLRRQHQYGAHHADTENATLLATAMQPGHLFLWEKWHCSVSLNIYGM